MVTWAGISAVRTGVCSECRDLVAGKCVVTSPLSEGAQVRLLCVPCAYLLGERDETIADALQRDRDSQKNQLRQHRR